ncbi:MAG: hypothetical protein ABR586_06740 [Thermoplasmatota archaeon]
MPERLVQRADGLLDHVQLLPADASGSAPQPTDVDLIRPGQALVVTIPGDGTFRCTASFLFKDGASPPNHYLSTAGHCVLPSTAVATHGVGANYNPSGVTVYACHSDCLGGGKLPGALYASIGPVVYARQARTLPASGCPAGQVGNDFALVKLSPAWYNPPSGFVTPRMAVWQGPYGSNSNEGTGNLLVEYGDGIAHTGVSLDDGAACSFQAVLGGTTGAGADGGAAVSFGGSAHNAPLGGEAALGTLTHKLVGAGGVVYGTTLARGVQMASTDAGLALTLCDATTATFGC